MIIFVLAAIFFGPVLFGAKLLGASWLFAIFIACSFYPVVFVLWVLLMVVLDAWNTHQNRKRFKARRRARR